MDDSNVSGQPLTSTTNRRGDGDTSQDISGMRLNLSGNQDSPVTTKRTDNVVALRSPTMDEAQAVAPSTLEVMRRSSQLQQQHSINNDGITAAAEALQGYNFSQVKQQKIMERLQSASQRIDRLDYEGALIEFQKIIFYDKTIPEAYAERAEIYIKLCDFSSAISNFKKALQLRQVPEWEVKLRQLYFMKGLTLIEEGYCNDALNLVSQINSEDVKFIYLKALAYIRAGNKQLAFAEIDRCLERDPFNVEVMILKGKLLWSIDKIDEGNEMFWAAHAINPEHHEIVEFLSIMRPRAEEFYKKATKFIFEGNKALAYENIKRGLELFHDMSKLLLLRASMYRQQRDYEMALNDLEKASKFMFAEGLESEVKAQIGLTYNDMGSSLFQKKKYHDSVTIFNEALNFMPHDAGIQTQNSGYNEKLCDAYRELKKFNLALSDYHYAIDLGGDSKMIQARLSLTHYALGSQCFNQKDYEGANIEYSRAIEYFDGNAEYYVNRARSSLEMGIFEPAYADLQKALDIDPSHDMATSLISNFNREKRLQFVNGRFFKQS